MTLPLQAAPKRNRHIKRSAMLIACVWLGTGEGRQLQQTVSLKPGFSWQQSIKEVSARLNAQ
jgi:hypothetical protein